MRAKVVRLTVCGFLLLCGKREDIAAQAPEAPLRFNRDIRPILSDNCFQCHGPDQAQRKGDLRLDHEAGALADLGGRRALVPGQPDESELYRRIQATDPAERMPPPKSGRKLTQDQIGLIGRWIRQGAKWERHWAFIPPERPALPPADRTGGSSVNPIDRFVVDRLSREGLRPAPPADKNTLLRRVTLDLTGLPPTPAEVDAFLADHSPEAYDKVVERLLRSHRFGERLAYRWLDGARYADTSGYQSDGERVMWRWRDWVIEAFNRNLPFDQFTVEQIAGDLLAHPTLDQLLATGFNRNHRGNAEGGIVPEEYAVEYVVDRVETTSTVWLGLTIGCARCHDHKFDPISQKEFYELFAYFNNVPEKGRAVKFGNSPPYLKTPTRAQQKELEGLRKQADDAKAQFDSACSELAAGRFQWEQSVSPAALKDWTETRGQIGYWSLDRADLAQREAQPNQEGAQGLQFEQGEPAFGAGRRGEAADFDGRRFINAGGVGQFGFDDKFTLAAWVLPRGTTGGTIISRMTDAAEADGYAVVLSSGKVQVNLVKRWLDDALRVETVNPIVAENWQHIAVVYDGTRDAGSVKVYINGVLQPIRILLDGLNQSFLSKEPLRIGGGNGPDGRFHGLIDDVRVYTRALSADEVEIVSVAEPVGEILRLAPENRSRAQSTKLSACYLQEHAPESIRKAFSGWVAARESLARYEESLPTTMIMQEMPTPRETHVLVRGEYNRPGDRVGPSVPVSLGQLRTRGRNDRLALAQWLVDPSNPLTARVAVNRFWQMLFGVGIVKTVDDFGSQGDWPSHPELLDWLALEFASDWDVKRLLTLMVTSATYRQSSRVTPESVLRDPENRLLARGPRLRLSAEMIRDQALFAAGLLVETPGGPSVKPYQPDGLWKELADSDYVQDHGESLYRRGLYTYWKRTVAPPFMMTFDAAGRETCIVRETRTNTPLQALNLMNDVTYVEAARVLAQRVMTSGGNSPAGKISQAFQLVTSRQPTAAELEVLVSGWQQHADRFRRDGAAAEKLTSLGEFPVPANLDRVELAAFTTIAGLILNLDEAITKE